MSNLAPKLTRASLDNSRSVSVTAAPALGVRWLFGVALVVPMLLAAGVYWLHNVPAGTGPRAVDTVVEVHLVSPSVSADRPKETLIQPTPASRSEPLMKTAPPTTDQAVEEQSLASLEPSPPPAEKSEAAPPAAPTQLPANRIALQFRRTLFSHIAKYQHYPREARNAGVEGSVQVYFTMRRNGSIANIWIQKSSGYAALDAAALDTVRKAQPLPGIPGELPDRLNILIPVSFGATGAVSMR